MSRTKDQERTAASQPATGQLEYRFMGKDGAYRWLGDHINVLPDSTGRPLYRLGIVRDITERKTRDEELARLNRTLAARSHSERALLRATTEAEYMAEVCQIIVEDCSHAMVWIGFAEDDDNKTVRPVAYAGFEEGYLETLHLTWADTERGCGPTGMAIRSGEPSFCRNMLTDPQFEPWRDEALARGYASSLALPMLEDGRAFGVLAIYFRQPDPFTEDEIALLQRVADDLAYGIRMLRLRQAHAKAEQALRKSEERYRHLFSSMTEGFGLHEIVCDAEGNPFDYRFLDVNPAFERLTGLKREDLLGRTVLEVLPGTKPFWIETYGHVALTGEPIHSERYSRTLGRYYEVLAFRPAENQFAALFLDVTARKQAEEALRRAHDELEQRVLDRTADLRASEERFRQLAEAIHEVFWLLEPDTRQVLYVSPAYDTIWGRSRQELYEKPLSFLESVHPDDRQALLQGFTPGWQAYDGELRIVQPDGTSRWIRLRSFPVRNEQRRIYRLAGTATDLTEQKAAEAALMQAERLAVAGKLAASLVHEINNPLQAVIGCLGLARVALANGQNPDNYLQIAHQEVQRTARIVSQLHSLGRPMQTLQKESTDLNCLLRDVLVLNRNQLENTKIEVVWEEDAGLPTLPVVADAMRQVFLNLVLNAMDAMPGGGQLRVSTARSESPTGVRVAFADSGAGISPEALPHLFEAFHSTKAQGLGMGLFVCQGIVQQHGGRIEVESQPGAGTTFTVWLPA